MKIGNIPRKETPTKFPPLLPLVLEKEDKDKPKGKSVSHSLRVTPTDANSTTYKTSVHVLDGAEDVRTIIKHPQEIQTVLTGLNVTTVSNKLLLIKTLLTGNALTQFNASLELMATDRMEFRIDAERTNAAKKTIRDAGWNQPDNFHDDDVEGYLQGMVTRLVPSRALAKVKRHIRRHCRKPADMGIREYFQNLFRINTQEIPALPPFAANQAFRDDEFIDIILFGTPTSWAREMDRQGFDPMDHTVEEVVTFMEQLESAEVHDRSSTETKSNKANKSASSKYGRSNTNVLPRFSNCVPAFGGGR